jgi:hypothetical protein
LLTSIFLVALIAGMGVAQTIDQIQQYTETGDPDSPYAGETVTISGVVFAPPGVYNSGTHYIHDGTGGIGFFVNGTGAVLGSTVTVTGPVGVYGGEIQITPGPDVTVTGTGTLPTPIEATPAEILSDYEWVGELVSVIGTVSSVDFDDLTFTLATGGAEDLVVYIDETTQIDWSAVAEGDEYKVISPVVKYNALIELKPRYQSDLIEDPMGDTLPVISNVRLDNYVVMPDAPIIVSATIEDNSAVASANVFYRNSDGETPGSWTSVAMVDQGGDYWEGTIPAGHPQSQVDYYVEATDDGDQTVTLPGNAPDGFSRVAVGMTPIFDLQYVDPDAEDQTTPYLDRVLNIHGVITAAGENEAADNSKFILQTLEPHPTEGYRWGAVLVYESSATYEYFRGDEVEVGGYGDEYYDLSEMIPHNADAVNLVGFGTALPEPERVRTRVLADNTLEDGNGYLGEAYESVWVKTYAAKVLGTSEFLEFYVSDTEAWADSVEVEPAVELSYAPTVGDVIYAEGFMDYDFGAFQVTPLRDEFIILTDWVGVDDTPTVEAAGGFKSIYPNPFNPATKLSFVVARDELTQLNIYNIRGELVRTLVNERLPMGDYQLTWDGQDAGGSAVASGQYFARLRIGKTVLQVRKLSLVK